MTRSKLLRANLPILLCVLLQCSFLQSQNLPPCDPMNCGDGDLTDWPIPDPGYIELYLTTADCDYIPEQATIISLEVAVKVIHSHHEDLTIDLTNQDGSRSVNVWNREPWNESEHWIWLPDVHEFDGDETRQIWILRVQDWTSGNVGYLYREMVCYGLV